MSSAASSSELRSGGFGPVISSAVLDQIFGSKQGTSGGMVNRLQGCPTDSVIPSKSE